MVSMDRLLRHRLTKEAETDRLIPNDAGACPLLYPFFSRVPGMAQADRSVIGWYYCCPWLRVMVRNFPSGPNVNSTDWYFVFAPRANMFTIGMYVAVLTRVVL